MIRALKTAAAALTLAAAPLMASAEGDFAEGSIAKSWNLLGEENALFTAKVVDVLCELTGDCAPDCGGGARQLGLLRESDGVLVLAMKNLQTSFNGAVADLAPYCGQVVDVDGLLIGDEDQTAVKFYQVQHIRPTGGEWAKANGFTRAWAERFPEATGKGPWFRRDPRVLAEIGKDGYLGLGPEIDAEFIEYYFE